MAFSLGWQLWDLVLQSDDGVELQDLVDVLEGCGVLLPEELACHFPEELTSKYEKG